MVLELLGLAIAIAALFPDTPTGKFLIHAFVERPSRWFAKVTPSKLFFCLVVATAFVAFSYVSIPADLAFLWAGDVAFYLEAVTAVYLLVVNRFAGAALRNTLAKATRAVPRILALCQRR